MPASTAPATGTTQVEVPGSVRETVMVLAAVVATARGAAAAESKDLTNPLTRFIAPG